MLGRLLPCTLPASFVSCKQMNRTISLQVHTGKVQEYMLQCCMMLYKRPVAAPHSLDVDSVPLSG